MRLSLWKILSLLFLALLGLGGGVYTVYLYSLIEDRFEQVTSQYPSRIYSNVTELKIGQPYTPEALEKKLTSLGYLLNATSSLQSGEYQVDDPNTFQVFVREFDLPESRQKGDLLEIKFAKGKVAGLARGGEKQPVSVAFLEPELIATIYGNRLIDRTYVPLSRVSPQLIQAVIAVEDRRFYSHPGFDPVGIFRAAYVNWKAGRIVQGGSTITQQLVKNLFLDTRRSYLRKFKEVLLAVLLELRYSKNAILEAYLNEVYLGQQGPKSIAGVEEGARYYFGKNVSRVTAAESALLAGLIRSPGSYSPFLQKERSLQRRNTILKLMAAEGQVARADLEAALQESLPEDPHLRTWRAPHFVQYVSRVLEQHYTAPVLATQGLKVFTTLDMDLQNAAERAVGRTLGQFEAANPSLRKSGVNGQGLAGAFVAIEPGTGKMLAYVGGREPVWGGFDRLSMSRRQPGSSFKPFVYMTALDQRFYTLSSTLMDVPMLILHEPNKVWTPKNYDMTYHGPVLLRQALERSYNGATVWLGYKVGLDDVARYAQKAGLSSITDDYPSFLLGGVEVSPLELAYAYTIFPNNGYKTKPSVLNGVVARNGDRWIIHPSLPESVITGDVAFLMNQALSGVIRQGTASRARSLAPTGLAGKTGTSSDLRDSWFVGYSRDLLALAWVGFDDNSPTGLSGSQAALPVWMDFMKTALSKRPPSEFEKPENIVAKSVDARTGQLANPYCGNTYNEYFIEGTEPVSFSRCEYYAHYPEENESGEEGRVYGHVRSRYEAEDRVDSFAPKERESSFAQQVKERQEQKWEAENEGEGYIFYW